MYKIIKSKYGNRYMKDSRFISKDKIPADILIKLDRGEINQPLEEEKQKPVDKKCIFCGVESNWTRPINGQAIYICQEHYYSETVGKIVETLREKEKINA